MGKILRKAKNEDHSISSNVDHLIEGHKPTPSEAESLTHNLDRLEKMMSFTRLSW